MYKLKIFYDDDFNLDPRKDDNFTKIFCLHKRYNLGDNNIYLDISDCNDWDEIEQKIENEYEPVIIKPLYLYDHGNITISTHPFNCRWDSGQVGFVWIDKETYESSLKDKNIDELEEILEYEVKIYDLYLQGNVYGFVIEKHNKCECCGSIIDTEIIESCTGYITDKEEELIEMMKHSVSKEFHYLFDEWDEEIIHPSYY